MEQTTRTTCVIFFLRQLNIKPPNNFKTTRDYYGKKDFMFPLLVLIMCLIKFQNYPNVFDVILYALRNKPNDVIQICFVIEKSKFLGCSLLEIQKQSFYF